MQKQKILYLITKSDWGGAQRYVFDLATGINKEVYEPVVALGGTNELYDKLREAGLKVIVIRGLGRDVSIFRDIISAINIFIILLKERPVVLHINSSKVGVLGTLIGRITFVKKVVFTCHGWAFNENRPPWQKSTIKFLQWLTVLLSHQTIVVSQSLRSDLRWPLIQKKMRVVYLGRQVVNLKDRVESREILATKILNNEISLYDHIDDVWLGTIAELHPTKCLDVAISAMAKLTPTFPNLRYLIIHDGQEREQLEAQVEKLSLKQNVFFTGTIKDAARLLPAFDLFILPSRSEAFGYVLVEAGLAGIPVVASNVGGIPEVINDKETGLLIKPCDTEALVGAIKLLLNDDEMRNSFAKAHKTYVQKFTLTEMINETEKVYVS